MAFFYLKGLCFNFLSFFKGITFSYIALATGIYTFFILFSIFSTFSNLPIFNGFAVFLSYFWSYFSLWIVLFISRSMFCIWFSFCLLASRLVNGFEAVFLPEFIENYLKLFFAPLFDTQSDISLSDALCFYFLTFGINTPFFLLGDSWVRITRDWFSII